MSERPVLLPTSAQNETFANLTYHLDGELVPVLTIEISPGHSVYFEHHIMLWKNPTVNIGIKPMKGALKRMMAGMQIFVTAAEGHGQIAFSRDGAGHIVPIHMPQGQELHVREHQFLAASQNINYSFERVKGFSNMLLGGTGFFIDKFHSHQGDGILWLHGYGNVFERVLAPNEQIDVEPGGWLYKDPTVTKKKQKIPTLFPVNIFFFFSPFRARGGVFFLFIFIHLGKKGVGVWLLGAPFSI